MYKIFSSLCLSLALLSGCGTDADMPQPTPNTAVQQSADVTQSSAIPMTAEEGATSEEANIAASTAADGSGSIVEDEELDSHCHRRCVRRRHYRRCRTYCH